jgi:hypothetical protein
MERVGGELVASVVGWATGEEGGYSGQVKRNVRASLAPFFLSTVIRVRLVGYVTTRV